jgi:hypothetical protein
MIIVVGRVVMVMAIFIVMVTTAVAASASSHKDIEMVLKTNVKHHIHHTLTHNHPPHTHTQARTHTIEFRGFNSKRLTFWQHYAASQSGSVRANITMLQCNTAPRHRTWNYTRCNMNSNELIAFNAFY